MTEEENDVNENDIAPGGKIDFLGDDASDHDEDTEDSDKDTSMSFSFGGSRGFEE